MCGEGPRNQMERLLYSIVEETPRILMDDDGNMVEASAEGIAKELQTSPQVIGKLMSCCLDVWKRVVRDGKVFYIPVEE